MLDAVLLSRIQFAITAAYHFLFVPLTIGLVILVAIMETLYVRTKNDKYRRMADFWGKLFTINFALGIVTGITMEFQFGTNWSVYSEYMGDIFGSPLAIEALFAFFLESTFIGLWIFGKDKISPKLRAFSMWMVALGTNISALWIITANGFMQAPTGYVLNNGRIELASFGELISNPYTWYMFFHTIVACYIVGGFFVMGVSAYHLIKNKNTDFFKTSFKMGMILSIVATTLIPILGHYHGVNTAKMQPAKAAAMEAVWESGKDHPFHLLQIPDAAKEKNALEAISIPYLGSFLYTNDIHGEVTGLKDIPENERPNVAMTFWSFRLMVVIGILMLGLSWYAFYLYRKNRLQQSKKFLKLVLYSIPLPYIAITLGWMVAEVGRQPWIVYGLMKTNEAVSPVSPDVILFSMVGLFVFYTLLIIADIFLLRKYAIKGPSDDVSASEEHPMAS
jgi:cytochrome d ubiquinol oxidase subunit I